MRRNKVRFEISALDRCRVYSETFNRVRDRSPILFELGISTTFYSLVAWAYIVLLLFRSTGFAYKRSLSSLPL